MAPGGPCVTPDTGQGQPSKVLVKPLGAPQHLHQLLAGCQPSRRVTAHPGSAHLQRVQAREQRSVGRGWPRAGCSEGGSGPWISQQWECIPGARWHVSPASRGRPRGCRGACRGRGREKTLNPRGAYTGAPAPQPVLWALQNPK